MRPGRDRPRGQSFSRRIAGNRLNRFALIVRLVDALRPEDFETLLADLSRQYGYFHNTLLNLVMTGLLFVKEIDLTIRHRFGFWSTACRKTDAADMQTLKVESDGTVKLPPFTHPAALWPR